MSSPSPQEVQKLLDGPGLAPPPGVTPNLVNPDNLDVYLVVSLTLCLTLTTLAIGTRMYTKGFITRSLGWDDYTSLLAWLMFIAQSATSAICVEQGGGIHQWDLPLRKVFRVLYYINVTSILYGPTVFVVKLSILLQYLRIFVPVPKSNRIMYWGIILTIGGNLVFYTVHMFIGIFACNPREKMWNKLITEGHCHDANKIYISSGYLNVASDFIIFFLPLSNIWKLRMPLRRKIGVSAVFAIGLVACVTSITRLVYTYRLVQSKDVTYNTIVMGFWTLAEVAIGILCGCLPVLPKFFQVLGPKVHTALSSTFRTRESSSMPSNLKVSRILNSATKRSGASDSPDPYNDPYHSRRELKSEYSPLDTPEMARTEAPRNIEGYESGELTRPLPVQCGRPATGQRGLERSQSRSGIVRTVHIETEQYAQKTLSPSALERQQNGPWE
ncbi:MAG: hypothetical protein M1837_007020 [Sclerophora amabilis]|nr:MAG: hypothetical protein M1837_007020 [Sclerophora amabilis]